MSLDSSVNSYILLAAFYQCIRELMLNWVTRAGSVLLNRAVMRQARHLGQGKFFDSLCINGALIAPISRFDVDGHLPQRAAPLFSVTLCLWRSGAVGDHLSGKSEVNPRSCKHSTTQ